ncbi:hypothetical protein PHYC_00306 [Phycisphaerales bacterium]|nr:hypothetical protein PHYC_00306 [Phycisphaerales bacterium]
MTTTETANSQPNAETPGDTARLDAELADLRATLAQAREALDIAERRHAVELELLKADTIDLETARLLTQTALTNMPKADAAAVVAELRKRKPFLFRRTTTPSAMGAAAAPRPAEDLARAARQSGDRKSLLKYLQARRAG